jgi:hypothetical protein
MLFSALIAVAILADATPAAAAVPAQPAAASAPAAAAAPAAAPAAKPKPKVVCHTEAVIGSLFPKKTCTTVDQANEQRQAERQDLEAIQGKSH